MREPSPAARDDQRPWYQEGLRFSCAPGCRRCCGGAPGDVWVTEEEIVALAANLRMPRDAFERTHVRRYASGRASLRERYHGDCTLLDDHGCSVYADRPKQCRDYPFWPEVVQNPFSWLAEMSRCPGIGAGELHAAPKIADLLKSQANAKE